MRLKSYYAGTIEAAIALAGKELGPDALLVSSRPAPAEAARPGEYEVVFAVEDAPAAAAPRSEGECSSHQAWEALAREIAELRKQIRKQSESRGPAWRSFPLWDRSVGTDSLLEKLVAAGFSEDAARATAPLIRERMEADAGSCDPWRKAAAALESLIPVAAGLETAESSPRVVALVGPPGAGKTTTLVKLAAIYGLQAHRPVHILTMDAYRIAAAEQLRCYAAILGVGFQALDTPRAVLQAIAEHPNKELIFLDTPGIGPADEELEGDLRAVLFAGPNIDAHLVIPATLRPAELARITDRFRSLGARKLIFTHADETDAMGAAVSEAMRSGLPLSYFTNGQQIPEDLYAADSAELASKILGLCAAEAVAAA